MKNISSLSHSTERSLGEWLSYLENIHPTEIELGLARIGGVVKLLNIDFSFAKVITVAGTNGKGTTCAFLENALLAEGKSVAVYSSPHIEKFNERLRINKQDIDDQSIIDAFKKIENTRQSISLTYYEYTTLAAFIILQNRRPDYIILEVGLGGRLDATNIIDADIAVITTVDLDHQAFLGDNREDIGFEKAGIMRTGKISVVGDLEPPKSVLEYANKINTELFYHQRDYQIVDHVDHWQWQTGNKLLTHLLPTHIPQTNVATALMVLEQLSIKLSCDKVNDIITQTKVPGRTEVFEKVEQADIMLDVAHNPQAARYLAEVLKSSPYSSIHAVVGMLADKDIKNTLLAFEGLITHWYIGTVDAPRAKPAIDIYQYVDAKSDCFDNVSDAYKMALNNANANDLILVFGSFFTVSEIRRLLV
jgi:dihydrofolate synthase/folylpolyglutamate synthase